MSGIYMTTYVPFAVTGGITSPQKRFVRVKGYQALRKADEV
jgi:hypothetical protein